MAATLPKLLRVPAEDRALSACCQICCQASSATAYCCDIMIQTRSQPDQAFVEAQITYGKPPPAGQEEYFYIYKVPDG